MATTNSFDLLGDDDTGDITQLLQNLPPPLKKSPAPATEAKMPSKPLPPAQAVREGKTDGQRGGGRTGGRGRDGRLDRDSADNEKSFRNNNGFSSGYRQSERDENDKSFERRGYGGSRGGPRGDSERDENDKSFERRGYGGSRGGPRGDSERDENDKSFERRGYGGSRGGPRGDYREGPRGDYREGPRGDYREGPRGGRFGRDSTDNENSFSGNNGFSSGNTQPENGVVEKSFERRGYGGPRGDFHGPRRSGYNNGEVAEGERPPRRIYERHSGTARGNEYTKRDGAGRGNWGTPTDDITKETEKPLSDGQEYPNGQEDVGDANKENPVTEAEEKEPEVKEMTLEEYEKVLEEKRKALMALKSEERKVNLDKDFESMQLLSSKKNEEEIFVKLGTEKEKHKEATEKEEKARKAVNLVEFLKPAEGERYFGPGSRGGRGRGARGGNHGFGGRNRMNNFAPAIEDAAQFPTLGAK